MKPAPNTELPEIEIFRAGKHVTHAGAEVTFTAADLEQIAASYDPKVSEAPLVVGHPELNAPAYGWVAGLAARDGVLFATPHQVDAEFADLVKAGRYKKRSASFYLADTPANPKRGQMYLRHVGWLGAKAPAVAGLRDVQFASAEGAVEFAMSDSYAFRSIASLFRRFREFLVDQVGVEKADAFAPSWQIDSIAEAGDSPTSAFAAPAATEITMDEKTQKATADFAAREEQLQKDRDSIAAREKTLADRETKARREDAANFAEGLVKDGRVLPRHKSPIVEILCAIPAALSVSFAAADGETVTKPAGEQLRAFLAELPKAIDYAEKSKGTNDAVASVDFAAPAGAQLDPARLAIHAKAVDYQRKNPNTPYLAAVAAVGG